MSLPESRIPTLEVGNVVRTKRIEVAYDGEGGLITANHSAGRGKRFIIAVLGTTSEAGEIDVDQLMSTLGWGKIDRCAPGLLYEDSGRGD